jgi:hypothetical protein
MTREQLLAEMDGNLTLPYFDMRVRMLDRPPADLDAMRHSAAARYVQTLSLSIASACTDGYKRKQRRKLEKVLREYPDLME